MKKIWIILALILTLLCGCQADENTNAFDYGDDISKAQEIAVISPDISEVIETITSKEDIENFVHALDFEQWKLTSLPDEAIEIGSFGLAQEETIKLGQTDTDGTFSDIATITLYDNSYIRFEVSDLVMDFEVSEGTADYLSGYFE